MKHWFYVGRDVMWIFLGFYPVFAFNISEKSRDGFAVFVGIIIQALWVCAAVYGWFK